MFILRGEIGKQMSTNKKSKNKSSEVDVDFFFFFFFFFLCDVILWYVKYFSESPVSLSVYKIDFSLSCHSNCCCD